MGRFTERCIEDLLGELQVYAERANKTMSLITDSFQLICDAQEDTVDLTRIEYPDWYGNDFERECRIRLESYENITNDDIDRQFENYPDLVELYFSEFRDEERYMFLRKLVKSSSLSLQHQSLVLYDFIYDLKGQDCELRETFEEGCISFALCIIDGLHGFIREVVDLYRIYKTDVYEIVVGLFPISKDIELSLFGRDYITEKNGARDPIWKDEIIMNRKGQNNVLTDVLRRVKSKGYLTNPIPDIAIFLKESPSYFANTKLPTIET